MAKAPTPNLHKMHS